MVIDDESMQTSADGSGGQDEGALRNHDPEDTPITAMSQLAYETSPSINDAAGWPTDLETAGKSTSLETINTDNDETLGTEELQSIDQEDASIRQDDRDNAPRNQSESDDQLSDLDFSSIDSEREETHNNESKQDEDSNETGPSTIDELVSNYLELTSKSEEEPGITDEAENAYTLDELVSEYLVNNGLTVDEYYTIQEEVLAQIDETTEQEDAAENETIGDNNNLLEVAPEDQELMNDLDDTLQANIDKIDDLFTNHDEHGDVI
jgi:hypothetical protein